MLRPMTSAVRVRRAAVYGRESKGKTKSVADQIKLGMAAVADLSWEHAGTYSDKTSASRFAKTVRGDWSRLRVDLEAGTVDVLILWECSRGSRTLTDWSMLLDLCASLGVLIHVISHDRTYDPRRASDYKQLASDGVDAAVQVHRASESVRRGVNAAAAEGRPHGRTPYGFERVYDSSREFVAQRAHPEQSRIVNEIVTRVASAKPIRDIVLDLRERGVPSPKGGRWSPTGVVNIARNPAYIGKRSHKGELHDAIWPAIVPATMWQLAQVVLGQPSRRESPPGRVQYLLSAPLVKAPCGHSMGSSGRGAGRRYSCGDDRCSSISAHDADAWVTAVVCARLSRRDARATFAADDAVSKRAHAELDALEGELLAARESWARPGGGGISDEAMAMKEAAMKEPIADARRRARPAGISAALLAMLDAAEAGKHVRAVWDLLPLPAQRDLIRIVCGSITIASARGQATLNRWSSQQERARAAERRITFERAKPRASKPRRAA